MSEETQSDGTLDPEVAPLSPAVTSMDDVSPDTMSLLKGLKDQYIAEAVDEPDLTAPQAEAQEEVKEETEETEVEAKEGEETQEPELFNNALEKLREREKEIEAKKEELKPLQEQIDAYDKLNKTWAEDRISTLRKHVAKAIGTDDSAAIKRELQALYEDLTLDVLEVEPENSEAKKALTAAARTRRELEEWKAQATKKEKEMSELQERREHEDKVNQAIQTIGGHLKDVEHEYPYLMAAAPDNAGQIVWELMADAHEKGNEIKLADAAQAAEDECQKQADKFRHLLAPGSEAGARPSKQPPKSKPRAQTRTLTNSSASEAPAPRTEPEYIEDPDEAAAATIAKLGRIIRKSG